MNKEADKTLHPLSHVQCCEKCFKIDQCFIYECHLKLKWSWECRKVDL